MNSPITFGKQSGLPNAIAQVIFQYCVLWKANLRFTVHKWNCLSAAVAVLAGRSGDLVFQVLHSLTVTT